MALSSRLAESGQISGIIQPDIRYYMAGYPVRQLAGYPVSGCKNLQDIRYPVLVQSAGYPVSGYPAKSLSGTSLDKI